MNYQELSAATGLLLLEIDGSGVDQGKTYTDKSTGQVKPLPGRQTAYLWQGGKYPVEVAIEFPEGKPPYRPGWYVLGGSIFAAGDYGRVNFKGTRSLQLVAVDEVLDRLAVAAAGGKKAA